jgi:hypothetical protein
LASVKTSTYADGDQTHSISVELNKKTGGTSLAAEIPMSVRSVRPTIVQIGGEIVGLKAQSLTFIASATDARSDPLRHT